MTIGSVWTELESGNATGNEAGFLIRRVTTTGGLWLAQAIEHPGNIRFLSLRVKREVAPTHLALPGGGGFEARWQNMPGEIGQVHLQLVLLDSRFRDIFSRFVEDVIDHVQNITDERAAVNAFITQLERWQTFLRNRGTELLGEAARQGLFGELWILRHVLLPDLEPDVAINAWTGPRATPQDFQLPHGYLEVKTTSTTNPHDLTISSVAQLDDSSGKPIVLSHLTLQLAELDGQSLPSQVDGLRQDLAATPSALSAFESRLFEAGYLNEDVFDYAHPRYSVQNTGFYRIGPNFPRIIPGMLPAGISSVEYSIHLAACRSHIILKTTAMRLLGAPHG